MKSTQVKDIMAPLSDYATVDAEASLQDAAIALKEALEGSSKDPYHHRNVLVVDRNKGVVGKISQLDLIKGLEDGYREFENVKAVAHFGYDSHYIKTLMDRGRLWERPLTDLCRKRMRIKVKHIMNVPAEGEFVTADTTLDEAIHQMIMTRHHSLLVTDGGKIVGVLRLVDILEIVNREMEACQLEPGAP